MTKILLDCERMKYRYTGLYTFCYYLGQSLLLEKSQQEQLSFYMPPRAGQPFGTDQHYMKQHSLHKFLFPSLRQFDLWHGVYQSSGYTPRTRGLKKVLTIHDLNILYENKDHPHKIKRKLKTIQHQADQADHICAISSFVKEDLKKHLQLRGKEVTVIYNGGVPAHLPHPEKPVAAPLRPFIFTVGTIMPKKNFHVLPALLLGNDLLLLIAGITISEDYKQKIIDHAKQLGVADRIQFAGAVSRNDKEWYFTHCEAFAFPSIAEGFGHPPIEAMSFGKPVFLSTSTSLPEIGGEQAYYFDSFDPAAMKKVFEQGMAHYHSTKPMQAIRDRAAFFDWNKTARGYLSVYRSLVPNSY